MAWEMDPRIIGDRIDKLEALEFVLRLRHNTFRYLPDNFDEVCELYVEKMAGWPRKVVAAAVEKIIDEERDWPPWAVIREAVLASWPQQQFGRGRPAGRVLSLVHSARRAAEAKGDE